MTTDAQTSHLPQRFERPGLGAFIGYLGLALFFVAALNGADISVTRAIAGVPSLLRLLSEMFPPDVHRLGSVSLALLETLQMAVVGTTAGVALSFMLAVLASGKHTPGRIAYTVSRGAIALFRTVPDLIWALFFVVMVGLGPFAGTLAIMVDSMGFCGRFFAEAMEEIDPGPQEALTALGADRTGVLFGAIFPAAMPSFINTALFNLEKATRSSMVLGLVGAGGIGIELKVSMDMFRYDEACTILILVFFLVLIVERASSALRRRII